MARERRRPPRTGPPPRVRLQPTLAPVQPAITPDVASTPAAGTPASTSSDAPPATTDDPVAGELQSIDQIIGGIGGSVSGADSGTTGGE